MAHLSDRDAAWHTCACSDTDMMVSADNFPASSAAFCTANNPMKALAICKDNSQACVVAGSGNISKTLSSDDEHTTFTLLRIP